MKTSWQLCIVDYDRVKGNFKGLDEFLDKCETSPSKSALMNGEVVYCISHRLVGEQSHDAHPAIKFLHNVGFPKDCMTDIADVYCPRNKKYAWCMLFMLWPILTEKDAVEAEIKFSISLREYINR